MSSIPAAEKPKASSHPPQHGQLAPRAPKTPLPSASATLIAPLPYGPPRPQAPLGQVLTALDMKANMLMKHAITQATPPGAAPVRLHVPLCASMCPHGAQISLLCPRMVPGCVSMAFMRLHVPWPSRPHLLAGAPGWKEHSKGGATSSSYHGGGAPHQGGGDDLEARRRGVRMVMGTKRGGRQEEVQGPTAWQACRQA